MKKINIICPHPIEWISKDQKEVWCTVCETRYTMPEKVEQEPISIIKGDCIACQDDKDCRVKDCDCYWCQPKTEGRECRHICHLTDEYPNSDFDRCCKATGVISSQSSSTSDVTSKKGSPKQDTWEDCYVKEFCWITSKRFWLKRLEDESGVSGTGVVADGVIFPDGVAVLRWRTMGGSTAVYDSIEKLEEIHGHGGKTVIEYIPEENIMDFLRTELKKQRQEIVEKIRKHKKCIDEECWLIDELEPDKE